MIGFIGFKAPKDLSTACDLIAVRMPDGTTQAMAIKKLTPRGDTAADVMLSNGIIIKVSNPVLVCAECG